MITNKTNTKISDNVLQILETSSKNSNNPNITITSAWRSPQDQARIMCDNLYKGIKINYAAAGKVVTEIFTNNYHKLSRNEIEALMTAKIIELAIKKIRVSNHCVTKEDYDKCNIVDISKYMSNPIDFIKEVLKHNNTVKIIAPFAKSYFSDSKYICDIAEPAIHLEINTI